LSAQGKLLEALDAYQHALMISARLVVQDPSKAGWIAAHALRALPFSCARTAGELIPKPNAAGSPKTKFVLNFKSCSFIKGLNAVS
jgi:hypothetical protein